MARARLPAADLASWLREPQSEAADQLADLRLALVNQVGACFGVLAKAEGFAKRADAAADAIARFDDRHRCAARRELACGNEAGKSGTCDDD